MQHHKLTYLLIYLKEKYDNPSVMFKIMETIKLPPQQQQQQHRQLMTVPQTHCQSSLHIQQSNISEAKFQKLS